MRRDTGLYVIFLASFVLHPMAGHAQSAATAPAESAEAGSIEEVVVTAQKRSERLVDVPVSVAVVSGEALGTAGVGSMDALSRVVPGLHMDGGAFMEPSIRGVGTSVGSAGAGTNVPIYVDGFFHPSVVTNDFHFADIESVQVLKGPQGTLFGRNATGGAILVTTKAPSSDTHVDMNVGYGSFNSFKGSLYSTTGLADNLAGSIAVAGSRSDGYITNLLTGQDGNRSWSAAVRGKLLYEPTRDMKFLLTVDETHLDDPTPNAWNAYKGWTDGALVPGAIVATQRGDVSDNAPTAHRSDSRGVSLKSTFELGFATLTSYSGARVDRDYEAIDLDASSAPILSAAWHTNDDSWSQEFDLGSSGKGPVDWVTGLYYYHQKEEFANIWIGAGTGPLFTTGTNGQYDNSYAGFADATYNLDKVHLTLGARYSEDSARGFFENAPVSPPSATFGHSWSSVTPRAVLRYSLTDDSNVYVSWSKGTKAGLFNAGAFSSKRIDPEQLTDIEGGYKISRWGWQFETSAFHYSYKDLQVAEYVNAANIILNAANSEIWGFDAHLAGRLTNSLKLDLGGAYTHARYLHFYNAPEWTFNSVTGTTITSVPDIQGGVMERTPTFSGNISLDYSKPLFGGTFDLGGNYNYQTRFFFDFTEGATQPAFGLLNLRTAWTDPGHHWTFALSAQNVTDRRYLVQVFEQTPGYFQTYGPPVTVWGKVTLAY